MMENFAHPDLMSKLGARAANRAPGRAASFTGAGKAARCIFTAASLAVTAGLIAAAPISAPPAQAQMSDGFNFLKAVREREGQKVTDALNKGGGAVLINTRDGNTGETALHIVTARRDTPWLRFLIQRGADVNAKNDKGITPLMMAVMLHYGEGVDVLLGQGARPDETGRSGLTPLIQAVQLQDLAIVKSLLKAGADPNRADASAGLSARDYAQRNGRNDAILAEIDETLAARAKAPAKNGGTKGTGQSYGPKL